MTARGIDISSWQHPGGAAIDWPKVAASENGDGNAFAIVKATQGITYVNPFFTDDVRDALTAGLLVGAYHFAQPSRSSAADELAYFLRTVTGLDLRMGLWLDLEDLGSMQVHEVQPWAEEFVNGLQAHCELWGLYTTKGIYGQLTGAPWSGKLWLANPTPEAGDPSSYLTQTGQGAVPGITGSVDLDTLNVVRAVNPGPLPAPPPPPAAPPVSTTPPTTAPEAPTATQEADVQVPTLSEQNPGPGAVSEAVRAVQALLVGKGGQHVGPAGIDGRYGPGTAAAVHAYQAAHGLASDGICGPITWSHLCNN